MVQVAQVKFGDFYSQAYEPVSKPDVNPLKGTMANFSTSQVLRVSDYSVGMSYGQPEQLSSHRHDKQWGISADNFSVALAESVSKFQTMDKSTASSASLAGPGQARSTPMQLS